MAKDFIRWELRPVWRLTIAIVLGLLLAAMALAWPAAVRGDSPPTITRVEVTSSKSEFFHSPPLAELGGTVYFSNLGGQGADQIITVTVTVSDDNPVLFSGDLAFGIAPTTSISTTYGTTSTWSVIYTIHASDSSQDGILFTISDASNLTDTVTLTFTRDTTGPTRPNNFSHIPDADSGDDGFAPDPVGNYEDDPNIDMSWSASTDSGSGLAGYYLDISFPPASAPLLTQTMGTVTVGSDDDYDIYVVAVDNVGNLSSENSFGTVRVRRTAPVGGRLNITEISGGEYIHINPSTQITTGTLYYNHVAASSFRVAADTTWPPFSWGNGVFGWKVVFSPGWGESEPDEVLYYSSEYTHTYTIAPPQTTDVFTVSYVNRAGNVLSVPIDAELDTSGPIIVFSDFTPPHWPDNGVYWYRPGRLTDGWEFNTDVVSEQAGVDPGVGWAYWDHSVGAAYDQGQSAPGGAGTFTGVSGNPDGLVTVTVVLTDRVNNSSDVSMTLNLDGTPPVITPTGWSQPSSEYLYVIGDELFFSDMMPGGQSASLGGSAADNAGGSGLDRASFSDESNLAGSPPDDDTPAAWSGSYTFANDSTQGDGLAVVTVYDRVGNFATTSLTYTADFNPPMVSLLNVTEPGYDPDGDPLNDTGNWYAANDLRDGFGQDGWAFFFSFGDTQTGERLAKADWDHSIDAHDQFSYNPGLDGFGLFGTGGGASSAPVNDDADGVVVVTVGVEDNVSNLGTDSLTLRIDNTPPTITSGSWSESSQFLHAEGSTLYFSHQMPTPRQAALSGQANDGTGSGLDRMSFSGEPDLAGSPGPDHTPANWSGNYAFDNNSQGDGNVLVTLYDHLDHVTTQTYTYVLDIIPPTTPPDFTIDTLPVIGDYYNTQSLDLSWLSSTDNITGSGLSGYYLGTSNPPPNFHPTSVTAISYDTGSDGTFIFYLQARDRVGNASLASIGPITIDTRGPEAQITASPEEANRRLLVEWSAGDATTWPVDYDVQYRVNGGPWTPWLSATTATSQYFGPDSPAEVTPDAFFEFRVRARDYVNNQGPWSPPWGGSVTRRFVYLPLVFNNYDPSIPFANFDGFETGTFAGWKAGGRLPTSIVTSPLPPDGGNYVALLGSPSYGCFDASGAPPYVPVGQAYIKAYARVPATGTPYLRFTYRVRSYDVVRDSFGEWWDRLEVRVNEEVLDRYGNPELRDLSCSRLYDSGWQDAEFDLSSYAGQMVMLTFFNENHKDGYWNTYSYLDNIRIEVGP